MDREGCWGDFCTRKLLGMFCPNCDVPTEFMHARKFKDTMTWVKGMYQDSDKGYFAGAFVGKQIKSQRRDFDQSLENMLDDLSSSTNKAINASGSTDSLTFESDTPFDQSGASGPITQYNASTSSKRGPGFSIDVYLKGNKRGSCPTDLNLLGNGGSDMVNGFPMAIDEETHKPKKDRKSYVEYDHALDDLLDDLNASVNSLEQLCEEVQVETMEQELDALREAGKQLEDRVFYPSNTPSGTTSYQSIENCVPVVEVKPAMKVKHSPKLEEPKKQKSKSLFSLFKPKPRVAKADFSTSEDDTDKVHNMPLKRTKPRRLKKSKKEDPHDVFDSKPITRVSSEPSIAKTVSMKFKPGSHPESAFEPVSFVAQCQVEPQDSLIKIPKPIRPSKSLSHDSRVKDINFIMGLENIPDEELDNLPSSAFKMQQVSKPRMGVRVGSGLNEKRHVTSAYHSNPVISVNKPDIPIMNGKQEYLNGTLDQEDELSAPVSPMDTISSLDSSSCPTCGHQRSPDYLDVKSPWAAVQHSSSAPNTRPVSPRKNSIQSTCSDSKAIQMVREESSSQNMLRIMSKDNLDIVLSADDNVTILEGDEANAEDYSKGDKKGKDGKDVEIWLGKPGKSPCVRVSSAGKSIHIKNYKQGDDKEASQKRDPNRRKTVSSCYEVVGAAESEEEPDNDITNSDVTVAKRRKSRNHHRRHTYSSTVNATTCSSPDTDTLVSQNEHPRDSNMQYEIHSHSPDLAIRRSQSLVESVPRHKRADNNESTKHTLQKCSWNGSLPALSSQKSPNDDNCVENDNKFTPINFTPINKNYTSTFTISSTAFYRPLAGRRSRDAVTTNQMKNRSRSIDQSERKKVSNEEFISKLKNVEEEETNDKTQMLNTPNRKTTAERSPNRNVKQRPAKPFETYRLAQHKPHTMRKSASAEMLQKAVSHDHNPTYHGKAFITLSERQCADIKIPIPKLRMKINNADDPKESSTSINVDHHGKSVKKEASFRSVTGKDSGSSRNDTCPWRSVPREGRNASAKQNIPNNRRLPRFPGEMKTSDMKGTYMGQVNEGCKSRNKESQRAVPVPHGDFQRSVQQGEQSNKNVMDIIQSSNKLSQGASGKIKSEMTQVKKETSVENDGCQITSPGKHRDGTVRANCRVLHQKEASGMKTITVPAQAPLMGTMEAQHLSASIAHSPEGKQIGERINIGSSSQYKVPNRKGRNKYKTRSAADSVRIEGKCREGDDTNNSQERTVSMKTGGVNENETTIECAIQAVRAITHKIKIETAGDELGTTNKTNYTSPNGSPGNAGLQPANHSGNLTENIESGHKISTYTHLQGQEDYTKKEQSHDSNVYSSESAPCHNSSQVLQSGKRAECKPQEVVRLFNHTPENILESDIKSRSKMESAHAVEMNNKSEVDEKSSIRKNDCLNKGSISHPLSATESDFNKKVYHDQQMNENSNVRSILKADDDKDICSCNSDTRKNDLRCESEAVGNEETLASVTGLMRSNDDVIMSSLAKNNDTQAENCHTSASSLSCQLSVPQISPSETGNQDRGREYGESKSTLPAQIRNITEADGNTVVLDSMAPGRGNKDHMISQQCTQSIASNQVELASEAPIKPEHIDLSHNKTPHIDRHHRHFEEAITISASNMASINSKDQDTGLSPPTQQPAKSFRSISIENSAASEPIHNSSISSPPAGIHCSLGPHEQASPQQNALMGLDCNLIVDIKAPVHSGGMRLQTDRACVSPAVARRPIKYLPIQKQSPAENVDIATICEEGKTNQQRSNDTQVEANAGQIQTQVNTDEDSWECSNSGLVSKTQGVSVTSSKSLQLAKTDHIALGMQQNVLMNPHVNTHDINDSTTASLSDVKTHEVGLTRATPLVSGKPEPDHHRNAISGSNRQQSDNITESSYGKCHKKGTMVTDNNCNLPIGSQKAINCQTDSSSTDVEITTGSNNPQSNASFAIDNDSLEPVRAPGGTPVGAPNVSNKDDNDNDQLMRKKSAVLLEFQAKDAAQSITQSTLGSKSSSSVSHDKEGGVMTKETSEPESNKKIKNMPGSKGEAVGVIRGFLHQKGIGSSSGPDKPPMPKPRYSVSNPHKEAILLTTVTSHTSDCNSNSAERLLPHDWSTKVTSVKPPIHTKSQRRIPRAGRPRSLDSGIEMAQFEMELMKRLVVERDRILYGNSKDEITLNEEAKHSNSSTSKRTACNTSSINVPQSITNSDRHQSGKTWCNEMSNSTAKGTSVDQSQPATSQHVSGVVKNTGLGNIPSQASDGRAVSMIGDQGQQLIEQTLKLHIDKGPIFSDIETQVSYRRDIERIKNTGKSLTRPRSASGSYAAGRQSSQVLDTQERTPHNSSSPRYPWHSKHVSPDRSMLSYDQAMTRSSDSPGRYRTRDSPTRSRTRNHLFDEALRAERREARRKKKEVPDPDKDVDFDVLEEIFEQQLAELQACRVEDCLQRSRPGSISPCSMRPLASPLFDKPPVTGRLKPGETDSGVATNHCLGIERNSPSVITKQDNEPPERECTIQERKNKLEDMLQKQLGVSKIRMSEKFSGQEEKSEVQESLVVNTAKNPGNNVIGSIDKSRIAALENMLSLKIAKGPSGFKQKDKCRDSGFHDSFSSS